MINITINNARGGTLSAPFSALSVEALTIQGATLDDGTTVALLTPDGDTLALTHTAGNAATLDLNTIQADAATRYEAVGATIPCVLAIGDTDALQALIPATITRNVLDNVAPPAATAPTYPTSDMLKAILAEMTEQAQRAEDAASRSESTEAAQVAARAEATADRAEAIAKGASYSMTFQTIEELAAWASQQMAIQETEREVKVGDNLYIIDTGVPDYWWTGNGDGYAPLETEAVKVTIDQSISATSSNPLANKWLGKRMGATNNNSVQIGNGAKAGKTEGQAVDGSGGDDGYQVAVGINADGSNKGVAVGRGAKGQSHAVAVGNQSKATGSGVAIGEQAEALGAKVAIGVGAKASEETPIVIGSSNYHKIEVSKEGVMTVGRKPVQVTVDKELSNESANPVQNRAIKTELDTKATLLPQSIDTPTGVQMYSNAQGCHVIIGKDLDEEGYLPINIKYGHYYEAQIFRIKTDAVHGDAGGVSMDAKGSNVGTHDPNNEDSMATADNMNVSFMYGTLRDWGLHGAAVDIKKLTLFRRGSSTPNGDAHLWCRILRFQAGGWRTAYQSATYIVFNTYTLNGQRIEMQMVCKAYGAIPIDEPVILCFANTEDVTITTFVDFGTKVMASSPPMLATGQTSLPGSANYTPGWAYKPAFDAEYTTVATFAEALGQKQDAFNVGDGLTLENGVLSATSQGGNSGTVDAELSSSSTNPVQNKVVKSALDEKPDFMTGSSVYDPCQFVKGSASLTIEPTGQWDSMAMNDVGELKVTMRLIGGMSEWSRTLISRDHYDALVNWLNGHLWDTVEGKQNKLTAGDGITINGNTISASIAIDKYLSSTSESPVQNKVIVQEFKSYLKPTWFASSKLIAIEDAYGNGLRIIMQDMATSNAIRILITVDGSAQQTAFIPTTSTTDALAARIAELEAKVAALEAK